MRIAILFAAATLAYGQHDLFVSYCSACHGDTGKGGRGPDLTTGEWKHGSSVEDLIRNITKGIPGTQMPAIPMPESRAREIANYLLKLSARQEETITGDERRGREMFYGSAGCSQCHAFAGHGGVLGTDLTQVRSRMKPSQLIGKALAPIRVVETQGVTGVVKAEDTFTMQLMDFEQKWHLLKKGPMRQREQAHPAIAEDVVAFLFKAERNYDTSRPWKPAADLNVTFDRLKNAALEPQNWLTYWGNLKGHHNSGLKQITRANAGQLKSQWTYQMGANTVETTPIVVDGLMFVTGALNDAAALDAATGRPLWKYTRKLPKVASHCTVMTNRGFAILGDRLYMATLDTHLVALDAKSGHVIWDIEVGDYKKGYSITHAPLAIDGKIIVGVTSGECALTGWVDAYDAATGKRLWRTHSTPQPGDPNRRTWSPESSADFGGSPTWTTGTFDVETNTVFWMTGNPGPDYDGSVRAGDNLYSCSVLALDAATGKMKWWFQFTPHDVHDWDANETPMLVESGNRKLLVTAQRNGFYYVLDRVTGEFVAGREFARQTWAKGLDAKGRPIVLPNTTPTPQGNYVCPDAAGSANWGAPSLDVENRLFVVSVREACATYTSMTKSPVPGEGFTGGGVEVDPKVGTPGAVRALDLLTGERRWNFPLHAGSSATGVLSTAGGVVFASSYDGNLIALESKTGKPLWHYYTGANIITSPITYAVNGRQYVAIASQSAIFVFAL